MTQTLHPLYGEIATDTAIAKSIPAPPGVYEGFSPRVIGSQPGTLILDPGPRGFSNWRANGGTVADMMIQEDAMVSVPLQAAPSAGQKRIDILVGLWSWQAGPVNWATGKPLGVLASSQQAAYAILQGTAASSNPQDPAIPSPFDGSGRIAVPLVRISYMGGNGNRPDWVELWDASDHRRQRRAEAQVALWQRGGAGWALSNFTGHADVAYVSNNTIVVLRQGYYRLDAYSSNAADAVTITAPDTTGTNQNFTGTGSVSCTGYMRAGGVVNASGNNASSVLTGTITYLGDNAGSVTLIQAFSIDTPASLTLNSSQTTPDPYFTGITTRGARNPVTFSLGATTLPGAAIDPNSGYFSAAVTTHGSWTATVQALDALGRSVSKVITFTMPALSTAGQRSILLGNPPVTWPNTIDLSLGWDGAIAQALQNYIGPMIWASPTIARNNGGLAGATWTTGSDQVSAVVVSGNTLRLSIPMERPATAVVNSQTVLCGWYDITLQATDSAGQSVTIQARVGYSSF